MPRSLASKQMGFGMVNLPVKVYTAQSPKDVSFNQITPDGNRTAQRLFDKVTGKEVDRASLRKGYEYTKDNFVVIEPGDIAALNPENDGRIEIEQFVDASEIDPLHYDKTYYLGPDKGGERSYSLLTAALLKTKKVGIAKVVMSFRQHLVALRPVGNVLTMTTLFYADEINDPSEIKAPEPTKADKPLLAEAIKLIEGRTSTFDPYAYHDEYRDRVLDLIESSVKVAVAAAPAAPVAGDLVGLLRQSIEAAKAAKAS